ncbi:hypothetical protein GCM10027262_46040 [Nocardia tengchongensis]
MYFELARELQARMDSGQLEPGVRLPSESELAAEFGVNRLTVRQAMAELDRAGSVEIRRGVGTFVRTPVVRTTIRVDAATQQSTVGARAMVLPVSGWPGAVEEVFAVLDAPGGVVDRRACDHLHCRVGDVMRIDSLTSLEGQGWSVNSYWLPKAVASPEFRPIGSTGNVVVSVSELLGAPLWADWREFSAIGADLADAEQLGVATGSALLVREGISSGPDARPTLYTRRRIRGESASFVLEFPRPDSPEPR